MNRTLVSCWAVAAAAAIGSIRGQAPAITSPPAVQTEADLRWEVVRNLGRPPGSSGPASGPATRAEQAASLVTQANQLRDFRVQFPSHAAANEARRLEVLALCHAAVRGDTTQVTRRDQLIEEVRRDSSLAAAKRFEAVAWWRQTSLARTAPRNRATFLAAQESVTRNLIAEFPGVIDGYESLLGIARVLPPERAPPVLRELLTMPAAPADVRTEAQRLLDRLGLVGARVATVFAAAGATGLSGAGSNRPVVIYTWTTALPLSLTAARRFAEQAPAADFIGVCLDPDTSAARQSAASANLPGTQQFDSRGASGGLAEQLKTGRDHVVYLADRTGVIRDVQARDDFSARFRQLPQ